MSYQVTVYCEGKKYLTTLEEPMTLAEAVGKCVGRTTAIPQPCGGMGRCGKCLIRAKGQLDPPKPSERAQLTPEQLAEGKRLACQATLYGPAELWLEEKTGSELILDTGYSGVGSGEKGIGAAIDIGTTTVVAYAYRLSDGTCLKTQSAVNPQAAFGADVISRIQAATEGRGGDLALAIRECIDQLCAQLQEPKGNEPAPEICRATVVGNTAMLHLLCGEDVTPLSRAPFIPKRLFGEDVTGQSIGLTCCPHTGISLVQCISGFVGADITAGILATDLDTKGEKAPSLLVDIGTNGEMALCMGNRLLCCATAAGPALEGVGISRGMTARAGAIAHVALEGEKIVLDVIGGGTAQGFCGSGIVDATAALLDLGAVDETGRILPSGHPLAGQVKEKDGQLTVFFPDTQVEVTQKDIRAVQMAKSALCAGILSLCRRGCIQLDEIENLYLAGGVGVGISPSRAERIGLLPSGLAKIAKPAGNTAGIGAGMLLLHPHLAARAQALAEKAEVINLGSDAFFSQSFMMGMMFPEG